MVDVNSIGDKFTFNTGDLVPLTKIKFRTVNIWLTKFVMVTFIFLEVNAAKRVNYRPL